MDSWVWHQVSLELSKIDIQLTIKTEGSSNGGNALSNKPVQVGVGWALNVEGTTADIVDGFVIKHDGNISVF